MSSIEKLSIRGIRSFSPNREELIEFYHPLTVILGENGCGKTTIIECLKVACTGTLPPGSRSGQSFLHDPKIAGTTEVKARNCANKPMVVQRTFQLQQVGRSIRFKALDGVIRMVNEQGEKVSMSQKCGELDRHLPEMFGVSRVILESVIFCHQEESNWPLQEGAILKKRFDDLFEAAQYTKALDTIKKLRKSRMDNSKEYQGELKMLNYQMKNALTMQEQLDQMNEKLQGNCLQIDSLTEVVEEIELQTQSTREKYSEIKDCNREVLQMDHDIRIANEQRAQFRDRLIEPMEGSDEELQALMQNHDDIMQEQKIMCTNLQAKMDAETEKKKNMEQERTQLCQTKGRLEAKADLHTAQSKECAAYVKELCATYSLRFPSFYSSSDIKSMLEPQNLHVVLKVLESSREKKQQQLQDIELKVQITEDQLLQNLSVSRSRLLHIQEQLKDKSVQAEMIQEERKALADQLRQTGSSGTCASRDLSILERQIIDLEDEISSYKFTNDVQTIKSEIQVKNSRVNEINFEIDQLNEKIKVLRLHEKERIILDTKRTEFRNRSRKYEDKIQENEIMIEQCIKVQQLRDLDCAAVSAIIHSETQENKKWKAVSEKYSNDLASLQTNRGELAAALKHLEQMLPLLQQEKKDLEKESISNIQEFLDRLHFSQDNLDIAKALEQLEREYFDSKEKALRYSSTIRFLNTFMEMGQKEHSCPLCRRSMNAAEESKFVEYLLEKSNEDKIKEKIRKAACNEKEAYQRWKDMESNVDKWKKWVFLNNQIAEKSQELNAMCDNLRLLDEKIREILEQQESHAQRKAKSDVTLQLFAEIIEIAEELQTLKARIDADQNRLSEAEKHVLGEDIADLEGAQKLKDQKQTDIQEINRQLQTKQNQLQHAQGILEQLQNKLHVLKKEKLAVERLRSENENVRINAKNLREKEITLREQIAELELQEPKIAREVKEKDRKRQAHRQESDLQLQTIRSELAEMTEKMHLLKIKSDRLEEIKKQNLVEELKETSDKLRMIDVEQNRVEVTYQSLQSDIAVVTRALTGQEAWKRTIQDNLEYRKLSTDLENMHKKIDNARRKLQLLPELTAIQAKLDQLNTDLNARKDERSNLEGRRQQLQEQAHELKIQLCNKEFRDVEERYRQKLIQYETTNLAAADLERYYKALDHSLLQYHSKKIEEINTIIRSLWQVTYKGGDIDTIELVSGEENEDSATLLKAKKSYNYRVVMKKGTASIDMRGRCSAGQKVLAALVIRLALAETFCINCGILALDEPTTNLDTENKNGILHARSAQRNFQLICITHDEEFVQMLSRTQMMDGTSPEYYFRISREDLGSNRYVSKIERQEWSDGV